MLQRLSHSEESMTAQAILIGVILSGFLLKCAWADEAPKKMSTVEIEHYQENYDKFFYQSRDKMKKVALNFILNGKNSLGDLAPCDAFKNDKKRDAQLLNVEKSRNYSSLGRIDGIWDGRQEGCRMAHQLVSERVASFKKDVLPHIPNKMDKGEVIALVSWELEEKELPLYDICLRPEKMQRIHDWVYGEKAQFSKKSQASCKQMAYQVRRLEENEYQRIAEMESSQTPNRAAASIK